MPDIETFYYVSKLHAKQALSYFFARWYATRFNRNLSAATYLTKKLQTNFKVWKCTVICITTWCVLILQGILCWLHQNFICIELRANLLTEILEKYYKFQIAYFDTYARRQANYFVNVLLINWNFYFYTLISKLRIFIIGKLRIYLNISDQGYIVFELPQIK
jgi:hypothetical protein